MPELAEVLFASKAWKMGIGQKILKTETINRSRVYRGLDPTLLPEALQGSSMQSSHTHGKKMLFCLSGEKWLGVHLGMTGWLHEEPPQHTQGKHDALILRLTERSLVFRDPRQFGRVLYHEGKEKPIWWMDLPPEILSDDFTLQLVRRILLRRKRALIKAVLLMQEFFPGIGNWMVDEILWRARIHPAERAGNLSPAKQKTLWEETMFVTNGALNTVGKRGGDPPEDWLFHVRWKDGGACPQSGKPLVRETVAGRTTCWCPSKQRLIKK
jgi:formamidopyrimidine-DNA glycosylase